MPENITKIPAHLNVDIFSPKIINDTIGTITKDNAKNGYAKLRFSFDRMNIQSMKLTVYNGAAIRIQTLVIIDRISDRGLFFNSVSVIPPICCMPSFIHI